MTTNSHMIISLAALLCGKLGLGIPHYIIQVFYVSVYREFLLSSGAVLHMFMQVSTYKGASPSYFFQNNVNLTFRGEGG